MKMPATRGISIISDSRRDAEKYYKLLLAIESSTAKIGALEKGGQVNINKMLAELLPDLAEAVDAAQAFVAVYTPEKKNRGKNFDLVATYPDSKKGKQWLPWSTLLNEVLVDGRARVVEPFEDTPKKLIQGLELFHATTAILAGMQIRGQHRIIGLCNRTKAGMGPFLATDRRALESIVELLAIGLRVGERRRQELENIQNISAAISAELDPNELLPLIVRKATEVFSAPATSLMLWDAKKENLIIKASHGLTTEYVEQQRISKKKVADVLSTLGNVRTITTPNLQKRPFGLAKLIKTEGLCSVLSALLQASGELIGILNIYSQGVIRNFNDDERELAGILANHAAIAIHNARMRQREIESILATSDALKATLNENELYELISEKVSGIFNAPVALITLDGGSHDLTIRSSHGFSKSFKWINITARDNTLTLAGGKKDPKPYEIADVNHAFNGLQHLSVKEHLSNVLITPIVSPGTTKRMGFLFIFGKKEPRTFTSDEVKIAGIIADQAAIAIRTTQLHSQNKQHGEQLSALDQIALDITGELKIRDLLGSIIRHATALVQARGGIIYLWNEKRGEMVPSASYGDLNLENVKVAQDRGVIGEIVRTKAPAAMTRYFQWPKRQVALDKYKLTAVLGAPILSDDHLIGVIAVHDTAEDRSFAKADEQLLQRFANHAAVAIKNANAYASEEEAKDDFKRLISNSLDGIVEVDKDGYIKIYNEGAERICGYTQDEILKKKVRVDKLFGNLEAARNINRSLFRHEKLDNYETVLLAKNGQKIPITLSATLLKDREGKHKGSVGFFKDLRPLQTTLNTITAVTQAHSLTEGLNFLAEGMVNSLGATFCHILFLQPDGRTLKVEAAYPVRRLQSEPLRWEPGIGSTLDIQDIPLMKHFLESYEPVVYRKGETIDDVILAQHILRVSGLEADLKSALIIPIKGNKDTLGICTLGELRRWERSPFTEEKISMARSIAGQAANLIERFQTYETLQLREGLLKAGKEITSLQELPKILQSIADTVREAMGCDLVTLYTYAEAKDKIEFPTIAGQMDNPDALRALGYVSKKSVVWKILESRESHFADDAKNDPWMILDEADRHPGVEPFVLRERIESSAGIPLMIGKERVGIIFASFRSRHIFSEKEKGDMELFATQAAIAINNARLVQKEEKKRKHLEAVINAGKIITDSIGLGHHEILERMLQQAVEAIRGENELKSSLGTMHLYDDKMRELVFECVYPRSLLPELRVKLGDRLPVDAGMPGVVVRAALTHQHQLVRNVADDPDYIVYNEKTRSELAVPLVDLVDGDRLIGVLDVESDRPDAFDEYDVEAFKSLTDMAVVALKNAQGAGALSFANTVASLGAWGAEIAHDVNRETGAIQRKLYLLQNQFDDFSPEAKRILKEIEGYAESLILPPLPKRAPKPGEVIEIKNAANLDATITSYFESIRKLYPKVTLAYDLHCGKHRVAMHERWLHGLLRHLTRNAIKSIEDKTEKRVTIRSMVQGKFAKIEIEDTGKGVRPELLPILFQQPILRPEDERDGQGLLIVRFLVERHGGEVNLSWSKVGEGSCFYFTVPLIGSDFI